MTLHPGMPALATQAGAAYLPNRAREWSVAKVEAGARSRADTPADAVVAMFEVIDDLVNRADREARVFVVLLARMVDVGDDVGRELLLEFNDTFASLAIEAKLSEPEEFALCCGVLLSGATARAMGGDVRAGLRARDMASSLVSRHRVVVRAAARALAVDYAVDAVIDFTEYEGDAPSEASAAQPVDVADADHSSSRYVTDFDEYLADLHALGERFA